MTVGLHTANGRWEWTGWGWMWVSDYQWGWATYHYGRWWYSEAYGWVWSPGYVWAPAWVYWCNSGEYTGWYPIGARRHHHNGNHHIHSGNGWVFVNNNNFTQKVTPSSITKTNQNSVFLKNATKFSTVIKVKTRITNPGPDVKKIEQAENTTIPLFH